MAYTPKDNSGSAFRNDRKREGKKDADFAGSGMVNGQEVWIDIWTKAPENGKKGYFSISFRNKEARAASPAREQNRPPGRPQPPQRPISKPAPPRRYPDLDPVDPQTGEYKF